MIDKNICLEYYNFCKQQKKIEPSDSNAAPTAFYLTLSTKYIQQH
nr:MAG TPA: hypothetical protein [Caudoviricetes sp.]